jgi:Zn-dependent peptidase ImmA (M78 family)
MSFKRKAELEAINLLKELGINEVPTPLDKIANHFSIFIEEEELGNDISGVLIREEDKSIIGVNSSDSDNRKRFTIAHELGHFIMHQGNEIHIDRTFKVNFRDKNSSLANNIEEIEANAFAAALLMPEKKIKQFVNQRLTQGIDVEDSEELRDISEKFQVSKQALLIRLSKLGLIEQLDF